VGPAGGARSRAEHAGQVRHRPVLVSAGFAIMVVAARLSDAGVRVSPLWLIATYVLQTCGELCLSPVGLSMVTKLAPARFASLMMGIWFLAFFVSDRCAGILAGLVEKSSAARCFTFWAARQTSS
jgi:POT family proton-dependent oligopeptide transporter